MAVFEKGSVSVAAAYLGISQPAVSKHISKLEEGLGITLFKKGHKSSSLTQEGEILYAYASRISESLAEAKRKIAEISEDVSGHICISASSIPGDFLLPEMLVEFNAACPGVSVEVTISDSKGAVEALVGHDTDMAIIGCERHMPGFVSRPLFHDELVLIVTGSHPFSCRKHITIGDLADLKLVGRTEGSGTRSTLQAYLGGSSLDLDETSLKFGHVTAVINAVEHGGGAGVVSRLAVKEKDGLACIPFDPPIYRSFYLLHGTVSTRAMKMLLDFLVNKEAGRVMPD